MVWLSHHVVAKLFLRGCDFVKWSELLDQFCRSFVTDKRNKKIILNNTMDRILNDITHKKGQHLKMREKKY